jgi:predicted nuclease of predicted toxin-antitoxin system
VGKRICFYLDEHIPKAVADGLRHRGINVTRAQEVGLRRASDEQHLEFAMRENHVVVTKDSDFLRFNPVTE